MTRDHSPGAICPACRQPAEVYVTVHGIESVLKVGDVSVCICCAAPLIVVGVSPDWFEVLTEEDLENAG